MWKWEIQQYSREIKELKSKFACQFGEQACLNDPRVARMVSMLHLLKCKEEALREIAKTETLKKSLNDMSTEERADHFSGCGGEKKWFDAKDRFYKWRVAIDLKLEPLVLSYEADFGEEPWDVSSERTKALMHMWKLRELIADRCTLTNPIWSDLNVAFLS
jgi:hypothetical protein